MAEERGGRRLAVLAAGLGVGLVGREVLRRRRAIDLRGQVVLITGGSRGLGLALAEEFACQGARLVLCARDERELEEARARVAAGGAEVLAVPCDVSDRDQVQGMVHRALDRYGRVDVLVNNAGVIMAGPLETQTREDFEEAMAIMYWGAVYPTMAVLPGMQERRHGRIVNITSIGGKVAVPHLLSYTAAKFALVGFSEGLRTEVARYGIKVVTVVPGLMRTGSYVNAFYKGKHEQEYTWFSLGAALPFTSMSVRGAARQIVAATRRGDSEVILTLQAQILARFHGLFPGLTSDVLALVDRFLPAPGGVGEERRRGRESETSVSSSFLTALGRRAAHDYHQYGERGTARNGAASQAVDRA